MTQPNVNFVLIGKPYKKGKGGQTMILANKTEKELWELLHGLNQFTAGPVVDSAKYDIHKEIIRKEKGNEHN